MTREENREFARKTESLTKPKDITAISFLGDFNKYLPMSLQKTIMEKGSRTVSYMGFIVDPYCFFLAYGITDTVRAQAMLPEGYELAETALFEGEIKGPTAIISSFSVRTSVFTGMRVECYLIARNTKTGLMSWIIADYETNTTSHDPKNGFCGYSCDPALFTVTPYGEILAEAKNDKVGNRFSVRAEIEGGTMRCLDQELWVEGNLSIDYGGKLRDPESKPFGLVFDPVLMKEARMVPLDRVAVEENTMLSSIIDGASPKSAAVFPYSQHFIIRQNPGDDLVVNEQELLAQAARFTQDRDFKTMQGSDITKPLFRGMFASALANLALISFLLWKLLG